MVLIPLNNKFKFQQSKKKKNLASRIDKDDFWPKKAFEIKQFVLKYVIPYTMLYKPVKFVPPKWLSAKFEKVGRRVFIVTKKGKYTYLCIYFYVYIFILHPSRS